jgi:hypothetical protein
VLVLSARAPRHAAHLVQERKLPPPRGARAARGAEEFGTVIPDDVSIRVHDSNADMRYVVVPMRPKGTAGWDEEQLASILTRDTLVGVALPKV